MIFDLESMLEKYSGRSRLTPEQAAKIRGKQLQTFRALLPFGLIASAFNSVVTVSYLAARMPSPKLTLWAALMVGMGLLGLRESLRVSRQSNLARPRATRALYRPIMESALLGFIWALCPAMFLPGASGFDVAMILCVSAGMMTGAAYMLSTLPGAGIFFVMAMSTGITVGIAQAGGGVSRFAILALLLCFTVVMISAMFWNYSNYFRTWLQQMRLKEQSRIIAKKQDVISLLLNEFEQAASDCLWELDSQHRVVRPSEVLAERTGFSIAELDQQPITNFFDRSNAEAKADLDRLDAALGVNGEFNDLRVPVLRGGKTIWWRISAKPVLAEDGRFDGYRGVASDVTEKYEAEKQINFLAHYDRLTGVPKREMLIEALNQAVCEPSGFALHALDMDRFKTINDVYGHAVGDAYLVSSAKTLQALIGPDDIVARFGGDEFVVLQRGIRDSEAAVELATRIQYALGQPVEINGASVQSSVSLGTALYPDHSMVPSDLLKYADLALLASKAAGRDAACLFDPELNEDAKDRIGMENDLRHALENHEFSLNFQPIVHSQSGRYGSFETLIRWNHPVRGRVGPDVFVPILEQAGMITTVGDWIIREALHEAALWDETVRVSINLSPLQVRNRSLIATVTNALAQTGIDPKRVDFEITETALFDDTEESLGTLHALHNMGVTISLDDFGTGFSSLSLLRLFPFDKIKIDKSFIEQMHTSEECLAIVRSVLGLARSLGMRTTAEGVETASQAKQLADEGCVELQGYYFSRPRRVADMLAAGMLKLRLKPDVPDALAAFSEAGKRALSRVPGA